MSCRVLKRGFHLDRGYYTLNNLMWVVKDSTSEQNERQKGWREESQVGMGSASSGDRIITPCCQFKTDDLIRP